MRLVTTKTASSTPMTLLREYTPEEASARVTKIKREAPLPNFKVGLAGALHTRDAYLERSGLESSTSKKKRKKDDGQAGEKSAAMKIVRGGHLLK